MFRIFVNGDMIYGVTCVAYSATHIHYEVVWVSINYSLSLLFGLLKIKYMGLLKENKI